MRASDHLLRVTLQIEGIDVPVVHSMLSSVNRCLAGLAGPNDVPRLKRFTRMGAMK